MKELKDIRDDQIRVIGEENGKKPLQRNIWAIFLSVSAIIVAGVAVFMLSQHREEKEIQKPNISEPSLFEPIRIVEPSLHGQIGLQTDTLEAGFTEIKDTLINDIPIRIFIPHNAEMVLHLGKMNKADNDVIYAAQAADVRADNGGIVGAFVFKGKPLAWGLSKKGFCASINGKITIGVATNTPLFEKATQEGGYFFRQYPLVSDGKLIDNKPKGKSIRRAICDRQGEIFMAQTCTPESFHDFAQALVDLGADQAIYLVGSSTYGWAVDKNGSVHEFGNDKYYTGQRKLPPNTSYIVWRRR